MARKPSAPVVEFVNVASEKVTVEFGLDVIADVEDAVGVGAFAIFEDVARMYPRATVLDGKTLDDAAIKALSDADRERLETSPEELERARREIRLGFMAKFVAGCLGCEVDEVAATVPKGELFGVFLQLFSGFAEAMGQFGNGADEGKPTPVAST